MIPAYNCSVYLHDALRSVLEQNISEDDMQIEVVDDASTDANVEEIVQKIGKGRVKYFRQAKNVGSLRNFETCINRSKGEIIHLLHGDDRVKPGYYSKMDYLFKLYPESAAAFCRYSYIDEKGLHKFNRDVEMDKDGILQDWLLRIAKVCSVQYVSIAIKRHVYEKLGSYYGLIYGEDWEMWVRMAQFYQVAYTPEILAEYREHSSSITGIKFLNGEILKDTGHVFKLIENYLPERERESTIREARKQSAQYGLHIANLVWEKTRNIKYVNANIKQVMNMYYDFAICRQIVKLYLNIIKSTVAVKSINHN